MWQVVTNGDKYRLMDTETKSFFTQPAGVNVGWFGFVYEKIIEFSSKEEAAAKAKTINWVPINT